MSDLLAPAHLVILGIVGIVACGLLIPYVLYLLMLQRTLNKCSPNSLTISPGLVWLNLVPLVNYVMSFVTVFRMAETLRNEFNRRNIYVADRAPGKDVGFLMALCQCLPVFLYRLVPLLGLLVSVAYVVFWIMYWVKIAGYYRALDAPQQTQDPSTFYRGYGGY